MILRILISAVALSTALISPSFAGCERGNRLIREAGGAAGIAGVAGPFGTPGLAGAAGIQGIQGIPAIPVAPGLLDFADFFALMPGDNSATAGTNVAVQFPQDGATNSVIINSSATTYVIPTTGTYLIMFQASIAEGTVGPSLAGQLMLRLNGVPIANSVVGRGTGTTQIVGISLLTTSVVNSVLEVINPNPPPALTFTPIAGGTHSVSAHLMVLRIQ